MVGLAPNCILFFGCIILLNLEVRNLPPRGVCIEYRKGIATFMANIYEGRSSLNIGQIHHIKMLLNTCIHVCSSSSDVMATCRSPGSTFEHLNSALMKALI